MRYCPPAQELSRFLGDELSASEEHTLTTHIEDCPACQARLEELTQAVSRYHHASGGAERALAGPSAAFLEQLRQRQPLTLSVRPNRDTQASLNTLRPEPLQAAAPAPLPAVAGYELLGELGRGGMGVVYKARQVRLNRVVALKMILDGAHASAEHRARFRREAEAVGRLQHPNIVQVYDVGEQEGRPFFSMEYVPGPSLAQQLAGTPQTPRAAATLVQTLALAVQAAHESGIVHRDLKPANVLLASGGMGRGEWSPDDKDSGRPSPLATQHPKITDFGLAKQVATPAEPAAVDGVTQSGAILGSPSYMAPEQASGKGQTVGPAADVYALGAILYEMLTGRPPFRGATPLDTLMQVTHEEPVAPRRLVPTVPRDLETICLKCLERIPDHRYPHAGALAEDLRRFLAGEPIVARPTPLWERTIKWARRRPAGAALAVVCVMAFVGLLLGNLALNQARRTAEEQRRWAETEQARALANLQESMEVTFGQLVQLSKHYQAGDPRMAYDRNLTLAAATRFFERILKENDTTQPVAARLFAQAHFGLGLTAFLHAQHAPAEKHYLEAQTRQAELVAGFPAELEYRVDLAVTLHGLGELYQAQGRQAEAAATFDQAVSQFTTLPPHHPRLALHIGKLAQQLFGMGKYEESLRWQQQLIAQLESQLPRMETPEGKQFLRKTLVDTHVTRGLTCLLVSRPTESFAAWDRACELEEDQPPVRWRLMRARAYAQAGDHVRAAAEMKEFTAKGWLTGDKLLKNGIGGTLAEAAWWVYVDCHLAAREDEKLTSAQRTQLAEEHIQQLLALLARARAAGLFKEARHRDRLQKEPDLAFLREREDVRKFLASLDK